MSKWWIAYFIFAAAILAIVIPVLIGELKKPEPKWVKKLRDKNQSGK